MVTKELKEKLSAACKKADENWGKNVSKWLLDPCDLCTMRDECLANSGWSF